MMTGVNGIVTYQRGPQYPPTNPCNGQDPCHFAQDCYVGIESIQTWMFNVLPTPVYKTLYSGNCCYASRTLAVQMTLNTQYTVWAQKCTQNCPLLTRSFTQSFATTVPGCWTVFCVTNGNTAYLYHKLMVCGGSWNDWVVGLVFDPNNCPCTLQELDAMFVQSPAAHPKFSICWRTPVKPLNQLVPADFTAADWCGCEAGNINGACLDPLYPQHQCLGTACDGPTDGDAFCGQDPLIIVQHDPENPPAPCSGIFCQYAPAGTRYGCVCGLCVGTASSDNTVCTTCEYTQNVSTPAYT